MLNDSTTRALRTGLDVLLGILAVAAVVVPGLKEFGVDSDSVVAWAGYVAAATVLVSKVRNKLEDLGVIRPILYGKTPNDAQ